MTVKLTLGTDSAARKDIPVYSGFISYFPAAVAGAASVSVIGNNKHNPGQPLHHARGKSMDHSDCVVRHTMDIGDIEACINRYTGDGAAPPLAEDVQQLLAEANALVWRAAAWSQELHEKYAGAPLAPKARLPGPTYDQLARSMENFEEKIRDGNLNALKALGQWLLHGGYVK